MSLGPGYIGAGMLSAAVAGGVFASPPPASILAAVLHLHDAGAACVCVCVCVQVFVCGVGVWSLDCFTLCVTHHLYIIKIAKMRSIKGVPFGLVRRRIITTSTRVYSIYESVARRDTTM